MTDSAQKKLDSLPKTESSAADAMMASLRNDVAAWNNDRNASGAPETVRKTVPAKATPPVAVKSAAPAKRVAKTAPVQSSAPVSPKAAQAPFRMSYDGVSAAEYAAFCYTRRTTTN